MKTNLKIGTIFNLVRSTAFCLVFNLGYGQVPNFERMSYECGINDVRDISDLYGNGVSAADYDGDGDIDFYLSTAKGVVDRLYQNQGNGQFIDVAEEAGIIEIKSSRASLWIDYNGDQLLDLLVVGESCVNRICKDPIFMEIYAQQEDHSFLNMTQESGLKFGSEFDDLPYFAVGGLAAGDFDNDNFLDLVVTIWGGGLKLFHNEGDGTFSDYTNRSKINAEDKLYWQPIFHDFDEDGNQDIYINVDFSPNQLWINKGNVFEEQAEQFGLDHAFNEMGLTMSDFDNDGDLDIYVTNITRNYEGEEQHNILLERTMENGRINYKEIAQSAGVDQSGWDWGATFIDINNDGLQDLATTNGWNNVFWDRDQSKLWLNTEVGFVDVSDNCSFNDWWSATSLLAFDMDRDGDLDLLQSLKDNPETKLPVLFYQNKLEELPGRGNFLVIKPRMDGHNYYGIGSTVTLKSEGLISSRIITAGCSFYGQEPAEAFFGMGQRKIINEVIVKWPTNEYSVYTGLSANEIVELNYEVINAPTELEANFQLEKITLNWRDQSQNESGFIIYKSEDPFFNDFTTITVGADEQIFYDEGIKANAVYFYRVRAYNENVSSLFSNDTNVETGEFLDEEDTSKDDFLIIPSLIRSQLVVKVMNPYLGKIQCTLFDLSGQMIIRKTLNKDQKSIEWSEELDLPQGLYALFLEFGEVQKIQKIIVVN